MLPLWDITIGNNSDTVIVNVFQNEKNQQHKQKSALIPLKNNLKKLKIQEL